MIWGLRLFFIGVLIGMLGVTGWASLQQPIWKIPRDLIENPWFIATLFDAYFGFLTFYLWVLIRERRAAHRFLWLLAILCLGNIAMAGFALIQLFKVDSSSSLQKLLLPRESTANPAG